MIMCIINVSFNCKITGIVGEIDASAGTAAGGVILKCIEFKRKIRALSIADSPPAGGGVGIECHAVKIGV